MLKKLIALSAATVFSFAANAANHGKDIVDTAVAAGQFKTLATALQAAGLVETLKGKGPFTVFAPTDEAFAKVPKADLDALLKEAIQADAALASHVDLGKLATVFDPAAAALPARRLAERQLASLRADMAAFDHHHPFHE